MGRILLIEDHAPIRELLSTMLTVLGHSVLAAPGGPEGLARLEAGEAVDLVLTDLTMPEMSGWEVVRTVRARWPHLRVGIITGTPQSCWERTEKVDLLITKPVTLDALREAIERVQV